MCRRWYELSDSVATLCPMGERWDKDIYVYIHNGSQVKLSNFQKHDWISRRKINIINPLFSRYVLCKLDPMLICVFMSVHVCERERERAGGARFGRPLRSDVHEPKKWDRRGTGQSRLLYSSPIYLKKKKKKKNFPLYTWSSLVSQFWPCTRPYSSVPRLGATAVVMCRPIGTRTEAWAGAP